METVERHVTLPADPDEVWALLTRPDDLAAWLGDEVALDASPGAAGRVTERDGTLRHLVVDRVDAGRRLSWHWWVDGEDPGTASHVELTLTASPTGTLVQVVEQLPRGDDGLAARAAAGDAWSHRLLHLEALLLVAAAVRG